MWMFQSSYTDNQWSSKPKTCIRMVNAPSYFYSEPSGMSNFDTCHAIIKQSCKLETYPQYVYQCSSHDQILKLFIKTITH